MMNEEATIQWIGDIDIVTALISFTYRSVLKYFARELGQYQLDGDISSFDVTV